MRKTFEEFFEFYKRKYWDYNLDELHQYLKENNHPTVEKLIIKHGNPYPLASQKIIDQLKIEEEEKSDFIKIHVYVDDPHLKTQFAKAYPSKFTFIELKKILSKKVGIPADKQLLFYCKGAEKIPLLEFSRKINYYGSFELQLVIKLKKD